MGLKTLIDKLTRKYGTRNPIEIAKALGIIIIYEPLGSINGYYHSAYRTKIIHINCALPEHKQIFVAAHELGHAMLHPKANTPFMRECTYFIVDKFEVEANRFAVNLLISDSMLEEHKDLTVYQAAHLFGIHERIMQLRLEKEMQ